jgi:hypothetical protein
MSRLLRLLLLALALLPAPVSADFTEYEDQPFLTPGGAEVDALNDAEPVPEGGASFLTAFPTGVKLVRGNLDISDIDTYQLQLSNGQLLLGALFDDAGGARLDATLGVFTGTSPPAVTLDDDGARGLLARLGHLMTSNAVRRVAVSGFGDTSWNGTHFEARAGLLPYELVLGVASNPPTLRESDLVPGPQGSNNSQTNADGLPENGALVGARIVADDVDYYDIDLEVGDKLYVAVFVLQDGVFDVAEASGHDPVIGLFGPTGAAIPSGRDDDSQSGFAPGFAYTVPAGQGGRYRFAVSGFGDSAYNGNHDETPFDYLLLAARERACPNVVPLISNIVASTGKAYVAAALEGGDHYYIDRTGEQAHVLVDVPEDLECGQWIKTANDDKNVTANPQITFTLLQDASVYVAFDSRATADPAWLAAGFTPEPRIIDIRDPTEAQEFDVYRRDFEAGTVQLGGNEAPGAGSMYTVVALPLDTEDPQHALMFSTPAPPGIASVTINGVTVQITIAPGQSGPSAAAALAAAVNANPTLQGLRIFALATGPHFVTTGTISAATFPPQVPLAPAWLLGLGALALAGVARRRLRTSRA